MAAADNHDGEITDLEPDILECKVKWALGSITMNKASGGDGIPVESEGDQPWVFFGRNDAKAETPVLWPPHAKS